MKKWMRRCSVMLLVLSLVLSMCCQAEPGSAESAAGGVEVYKYEKNGTGSSTSEPVYGNAKYYTEETLMAQALIEAFYDNGGNVEDNIKKIIDDPKGFVDGYRGNQTSGVFESILGSKDPAYKDIGQFLWAMYPEGETDSVEIEGDWSDTVQNLVEGSRNKFSGQAIEETAFQNQQDAWKEFAEEHSLVYITGTDFTSQQHSVKGCIVVLGNRVHIKGEDATYRALYIFLAFTRDSAVQRLVYTIKLPEEGETVAAPALDITNENMMFDIVGEDGKTESKRLVKVKEGDRCTGFWFKFDGEEPEDAPMDEDYTVQIEAEGINAAEIQVKGKARRTDRIDIAELAPFIDATETIDVTVSKAGEPFAQGSLDISKVTVAEAVASTTITETDNTMANTATDDTTAITGTDDTTADTGTDDTTADTGTDDTTADTGADDTTTITGTVEPSDSLSVPVSIDEITINGEKAGSQPIQVSAGEVTIGWKVTSKADQYTLAVKDEKGKTVIGPISVKADDSPYIIPAEDVEEQLTEEEELYSVELSAVPVGRSEADAVTKRADFYVHAEGTDSAKIHTVTFAYTGTIPDNATVPYGKRCAEGEKFDLPEPETEGYDFDGWTLDGKAVRGKTYTMPDRDITFSGSWTVHRHPVSFRYAEGSPDGAPELPKTKEYDYGETVPVKPMTMDGYTFTGWIAEDVALDGNTFIMPDHPVEFVGSWTANEYEVSYRYTGKVPKDAPALPKADKYGFDMSVTVAQLPELAGYSFSGWTPDDDSLVIGTDGSFTMPNHAVAFSGSWEANVHHVNYVNAEGSPTNAPIQTVTEAKYGETVLLPTPTLDGYTFTGWTADNASVDTNGSFIMPDADVTFVAHWRANAFNVAYVYADPAPEGAMMPSAMDHDVGTEVVLADAPVSTGYTFTGWKVYKVLEDGSRGEEIAVTVKDDGKITFTMPAANVVIVGSWSVNQHTVSYAYSEPVPEGAPALPEAKAYAYGAAVKVAPAPTMEGYTFTGWNYSDFTMGDVDVVITGGWEANEYKVTYAFDDSAPEGAQVPPEETISFGAPLELPDPEVTGYTFLGWKSKDVEADENGGYTMPSHDVTFVGSWQINTHTVTYSYLNAPENAPELPTGGEYKFGDTVDLAPAPGRMFRRECSQWTLPGNATPIGVDEQTGVPVSFRMPDADVVIVGNWVVLENKTGWIPWLLLLASAAGFVVATVAKGKKKQVYTPSVDLFSHESIKSIRSSHDRDREGERTIRRG